MQQVAHIAQHLNAKADLEELIQEMTFHIPTFWTEDGKLITQHKGQLYVPGICLDVPWHGWTVRRQFNCAWLNIGERKITVSRTSRSRALVNVFGGNNIYMGTHALAVFLYEMGALHTLPLDDDSLEALQQFQMAAAEICAVPRMWVVSCGLPLAMIVAFGVRPCKRNALVQELRPLLPTIVLRTGQLSIVQGNNYPLTIGNIRAAWRTEQSPGVGARLFVDDKWIDIYQLLGDENVCIGRDLRGFRVGRFGLLHCLESLLEFEEQLPDYNREPLRDLLFCVCALPLVQCKQ